MTGFVFETSAYIDLNLVYLPVVDAIDLEGDRSGTRGYSNSSRVVVLAGIDNRRYYWATSSPTNRYD